MPQPVPLSKKKKAGKPELKCAREEARRQGKVKSFSYNENSSGGTLSPSLNTTGKGLLPNQNELSYPRDRPKLSKHAL